MSDRDPPEFHRRSKGKAAHRGGEMQEVVAFGDVGLFPGGFAARVQRERLVFDCGRLRGGSEAFDDVEGKAADQDRDERLGVDLDALRVHFYIDAARVPEARVLAHEPRVRVPDENLEGDTRTVRGHVVCGHPADLKLPVIHRRADIERSLPLRHQGEVAAFFPSLHDGRVLQPRKVTGRFAGSSGIDVDVGAGEDRAQARHRTGTHPGADDPEARVFGKKRIRFSDELGFHDHLGQILAEGDLLNQPDLHVLALDLGLAGLEPFGGIEGDRDLRAFFRNGLVDQPAADQNRHHRDEPHDGDLALAGADDGLGQFRGIGFTRGIRIHLGAPLRPRLNGGRSSWRPAW